MRTNIKFATLFLLITSFGFAQKLGTIDSQLILSKMPELKDVQKGVQDYNLELEKQVGPNITAYQALLKEYQSKEASYTEALKKQMQDSILRTEASLQRVRQNGAKLIQLKNDELMRPLYQKMGNAIKQVVQEQGYTQILTLEGNSFAYVDPQYDITQLVMNKLGIKVEE